MKSDLNFHANRRNQRRRALKSLITRATAIAALVAGPNARAVTFSWITAGDGNWSATANWQGGTLPGVVAADTTQFNAAGVNANENIYVNATTRDIPGIMVFTNTGTTSILGGTAGAGVTNTLTGLNNITVNAGSGAVNFGSPGAVVNVSMDASTVTGYLNNSSNPLTFHGTINATSTSRPLVFGGAGDTLLVGALIGGRNISKVGTGTVSVTAASVLTTSTASAAVGGGILRLVDAGTLPSVTTVGFKMSRQATLLLDNSGTTNATDRIVNTAPIASDMGGGRFSLQGANDAASTETVGALTPTSGVLTVNSVPGADSAAVGTPSNVLTFASLGARTASGTLVFSGAGLGSDGTNKIILTTPPTLTNHLIGGFATIGNEFATYNEDGTGAANANGVQTVVAAAYTTTFGTANNVKLTDSDPLALDTEANTLNLQTAAGQAFTVTSALTTGAILNSNSGSGTNSISGGTIGNGTAELVITANNDLDISSSLTGNGVLTKSGAGNLTLSGSAATRTSANVFIHQGLMKITSSTALYNTAVPISGKITVGYNATLEVATDAAWTTSGQIPALTLNDNGATLKASGNSTLGFGKNVVVASLFSDASSVNLTATGAGDTIQLNSAVQNATGNTAAPLINLNGMGTVIIASAASNNTAATAALNGSYAWNVTGGGKLLVTSTGVSSLGLAGNVVTVTNGTLGLASDNTTNYAYVLNGGMLSGAGGGTRVIAAAGTIRLDAASIIDLKDAAVGGTANMNLVFGGVISGTGGLTVNASGTGTATLTLGGTNTYSGPTKVNACTLAITNPLALQNSALDTAGSGVINVTGVTTPTLGGLIGVTNLAAVVTTGYNNLTELTLKPATGVTHTYSGAIANNSAGMAFTLAGPGTQVLANTCLCSGATTLTAGTLALTGSGSLAASPLIEIRSGATLDVSALTTWSLGAGQTLKGTGTLLGNAGTSGGVSPGLSTGTLTVTGNFAFASGSSLATEITAGTSQVETATADGTATLAGNVDVTVTGADITGSPLIVTVPVLLGDAADVWAGNARTALAANAAITALYAVGGSATTITLTRLIPAANDTTLNISLANGIPSPGITAAVDSANTTAGVAPTVDLLAVAGALDVSGATLNLTITGTLTAPAYVIATYGSLAGNPFAHISGLPGNYVIDYAYTGNRITIKQNTGTSYADWLAANPPATGFTTDSDGDGTSNGIENILGTNPNIFSAGLTQVSATATSVTFQHPLNPTVASDVTYSYQWSTDLTEWKTGGQTNSDGTTATITPSAPVAGVITVPITITSGPAAKLFGRILATKSP
jgi:fibronectin-binding autotransporter adhesin